MPRVGVKTLRSWRRVYWIVMEWSLAPILAGVFLVWAAVSLTRHAEATGNREPLLALLVVIGVAAGVWIAFAI